MRTGTSFYHTWYSEQYLGHKENECPVDVNVKEGRGGPGDMRLGDQLEKHYTNQGRRQ